MFGAQLLLAAAALLITVILARYMPIFVSHRWLLPGAFFVAMGQGAAPMWYFQGIERVRNRTAVGARIRQRPNQHVSGNS